VHHLSAASLGGQLLQASVSIGCENTVLIHVRLTFAVVILGKHLLLSFISLGPVVLQLVSWLYEKTDSARCLVLLRSCIVLG